MKKALILSFLLFVLFPVASCGKKAVKPVTADSKMAQEAFAVAETIKNAYLKKDLSVIEKNSTKEGYREILGAIKTFDRAELTFVQKWIDIDQSIVSLKIAWNGTWTVAGQPREERGIAIFVFEGTPLKLSRILMANPFRQPE